MLPDDHPRSLGAFHNSAGVEQLLKDADLMVVVGSRLRSNETKLIRLNSLKTLFRWMPTQWLSNVITKSATSFVAMLKMS